MTEEQRKAGAEAVIEGRRKLEEELVRKSECKCRENWKKSWRRLEGKI